MEKNQTNFRCTLVKDRSLHKIARGDTPVDDSDDQKYYRFLGRIDDDIKQINEIEAQTPQQEKYKRENVNTHNKMQINQSFFVNLRNALPMVCLAVGPLFCDVWNGNQKRHPHQTGRRV